MSEAEIANEFKRVLELEAQELRNCAARLAEDPKPITRAIEILQSSLSKGGKIVVTGVGKSGKVGRKIAATLSSTGSLAVFLHPTEGLHGDLGILAANDAVLALSYTGNTLELNQLIQPILARKIPVIGLGGNASSQLARAADAWIDASVSQEACPINLAPTASTTLALAIGDALAVTLMKQRGFQPEDFALNHPGGSLGNRLTLKVADLMHQGESVGRVSPESPVEEVIVQATEKKLGGVLVVEKNQLIGIITDGDLRRALQLKEKFFSLAAKDLMTQNPVTVNASQMATEALELMEDRESQIAVLPVVENENWVGLIRLHDLVRSL